MNERILNERIFVGAVTTFTVLLIIWIMAQIMHGLSDRQTKYSYFYEALDELPETHQIVKWTDDEPVGRKLGDSSRFDIALKITESWDAFAMAMNKGNTNLLKDYFAATALERTTMVLENNFELKSNMVMMGMTVEPKVFHLDGSLFQFRSVDAVFARYMFDGDQLSAFSLTKDCILTNLILRQSGWKLANHERDCSVDMPIEAMAPKWDLPPLKGINYYPKNSPWTSFWQDYDEDIVSRDLAIIKNLGSNSIRIFLPVEIFTRTEDMKDATANLEDFLTKTNDAGIYVIPTLFDFRGELTPQTWSADRYYLDKILPVLQEAENIAYVDIKNELDLDEEYQNPAIVEAWLRTIFGVARDIAPDLRYSLGWSNAQNATRFAELMDVISYHEYGSLKATEKNLERVRAVAGDKPIIISEIGVSSYEFGLGLPSNLNKQSKQMQERLEAMRTAEGVLIWTLYDFPQLDPKAVSGSFWNKGIQKNFGLFDKFDQAKPAAKIFREWEPNEE